MNKFIKIDAKSTYGFSLVELMIAMTLGLLIVGATLSIFATNKQAYRTTENLGRVQENGRTAFELMARDVREAGGNPCDKKLPVANVLNNAGTWWVSTGNGIQGYENGALGGSVAGTDAVEVSSGQGASVTVTAHNPGAARFTLNTVDHGLNANDIVMACDFRQASVFKLSAVATDTVFHASGAGATDNCSIGLGFAVPMNCTDPGTAYAYGPNAPLTPGLSQIQNSQIVQFTATQWYVGINPTAANPLNNSLFRRTLRNNAPQVEAIIDGVQNMQITYLLAGSDDYVNADDGTLVGQWDKVVSVRVNLMLQSEDAIDINGAQLQRPIVQTINLRNRTS